MSYNNSEIFEDNFYDFDILDISKLKNIKKNLNKNYKKINLRYLKSGYPNITDENKRIEEMKKF